MCFNDQAKESPVSGSTLGDVYNWNWAKRNSLGSESIARARQERNSEPIARANILRPHSDVERCLDFLLHFDPNKRNPSRSEEQVLRGLRD